MKNSDEPDRQRHLGLFGATGVGVGAIVGGGILALAGVAFATTGPSAMLAFALNGLIALLTALSFAELSSKFPQSGGPYAFAKKVLSVEAAFAVGWVVWFASIVAAVLYATGFAYFLLVIVEDFLEGRGSQSPQWLIGVTSVSALAVGTTVLLSAILMARTAFGGQWVNVAKVIVFAVLIATGLWALTDRSMVDIQTSLKPFFSAGVGGLIQAMGYTFIALQGFDLIAAVGGEVRNPTRNIPRAMVLSLGIALAIYLPLLFVITTVGTDSGQPIGALAADMGEEIVAVAANQYLGAFGYWLVMVAAVLSMLSALYANLFAASRISHAMASDHTLPGPLSSIHSKRGTPVYAIGVTGAIIAVVLIIVPNVAEAGAAASLIFLVTFSLVHGLAVLMRRRSASRPPPFQTPAFPAVPVIGGLACIGLAIFQGIAVPSAGLIAIIWLSVGGIIFLALFARRARILDAARTALEPEMIRLRGRNPLVLVPIANPDHAAGLLAVAKALAPPEIGRVLLLSVVTAPRHWSPAIDSKPLLAVQTVLGQALSTSVSYGLFPEALTTVAEEPWPEIIRVAGAHRCHSMVLGFRDIPKPDDIQNINRLISRVDCDIIVLRAPKDWPEADNVKRILVPVAGRGGHDELLARLLGSLARTAERNVTFLKVLPEDAPKLAINKSRRQLSSLARIHAMPDAEVIIECANNAVEIVAKRASESDLTIVGIQRVSRRDKLLGHFSLQLSGLTDCPLIFICRRG